MLRVGIVGFGFMGRMHYAQWKALEGADVVAICDANPNIVEDTKKAVGNIEGAAGEVDFDSLDLYSDYNSKFGKWPTTMQSNVIIAWGQSRTFWQVCLAGHGVGFEPVGCVTKNLVMVEGQANFGSQGKESNFAGIVSGSSELEF